LDALLIRKLLRRLQPALVHAWGTERAAALVASRLRLPYVVTMQGLLTWVIQAVPSVHAYVRFMALLEPYALRRARVVTCESRFAVRYLQDRYPNLSVRQAEHAPHTRFFKLERHPEPEFARILAVGTLGEGKGTDLLLKALDPIRETFKFSVTLVGGAAPAVVQALQSSVSAELWARVTIRQHLTSSEIARELSGATLLAHPTRVDNSPNSVKEAAVAGVPVVASEVGGIPDYITHGKNGLLFPAGDLKALEHSLREAMTHPLFAKGKVDPATWEAVRDYLSPERMGENFLGAYQAALTAWNGGQDS
jgi:glycosyltransferase involved in cell wall biosynthesis